VLIASHRVKRRLSVATRKWVRSPSGLLPYRRVKASGRHPSEARTSRGLERQRLRAFGLIRGQRGRIHALAFTYGVPAEAIAGAILWDALENPYRRPFLRLGPGKVHPWEPGRTTAAERAEEAGLVPFAPGGVRSRLRILRRPEGAIIYIAAILAYHAANYEAIAGVDVRADPAVMCTLYPGGNSEARAKRLARRRAKHPGAMPRAADEMGPWVDRQRAFIRALLDFRRAPRRPAPRPA
jgi:hypothetical protein